MQERLLLIAEADPQEERLRKHFEACGFYVEVVCSGESAVAAIRAGDVDLVLLTDTTTATSACSDVVVLRATLSSVPLLHLQRSNDYAQRAFSLRLGSDDVVSTPFALDELDARVHALLRRSQMGARHLDGELIEYGGLTLNTDTRQVSRDGESIRLTVKEYDLLTHFLRHPNQVLSRHAILHAVWGQSWSGKDNLLDVYVRYLRKKIEKDGQPQLLQTVKGVGYILKLPDP